MKSLPERPPIIRGERVYQRPSERQNLRRARYARGEHHDVHVMGLVREDWLRLAQRRSWESD